MDTSGNVAMGLGGEDIVTDGASYIRIEQDIREMQGLLPPLLEAESTMHFFRNDELKEGRRESEEDRRRVQARLKEDSVPLQYIRDTSKLSGQHRLKARKSRYQGTSGI